MASVIQRSTFICCSSSTPSAGSVSSAFLALATPSSLPAKLDAFRGLPALRKG